MSEKHTPIPWHHHDMEDHTICGPDHEFVALCDAKHRDGEECTANTKLIVESVNSAPTQAARIEELEEKNIVIENANIENLATIATLTAQVERLREDRDCKDVAISEIVELNKSSILPMSASIHKQIQIIVGKSMGNNRTALAETGPTEPKPLKKS